MAKIKKIMILKTSAAETALSGDLSAVWSPLFIIIQLFWSKTIPNINVEVLIPFGFYFLLVQVAIILIITEDLVFWFVPFAWAGLGAAIGPTSILALS
jgi:hypothetical protein